MPLLGFAIYQTQELFPGLRIPVCSVFLVELLDPIVDHSIDDVAEEGTDPVNPSPRKINSPPIIRIRRIGPFNVRPLYGNVCPVFGNC